MMSVKEWFIYDFIPVPIFLKTPIFVKNINNGRSRYVI